MKKNLCLCYCPSVIEADDDSDLLFPKSTQIIPQKTDEKTFSSQPIPNSKKSFNKFRSYSRRKFFPYKSFPRLFKAILSQDPVRNIQQLVEMKSNVGWTKDEKCFNKLKTRESRKSEMEVEEVNQIPQENVTSVSHESQKLLSSNWTKPNTSRTPSTSCDHNKKDSSSLFYLIVFALFMTFFLGKYWAIVLTLSWLYSIPHWGRFFESSTNARRIS